MDGMEGGLLWIMTDPGEGVALEEFHDWYNNEHIPLQTDNNLPEFLTLTRYESMLPNPPRWMTIAELSVSSFIDDPRYVSLLTQTSAREAALLKNLAVVDRGNDEDFEKWYREEHIPLFAKIPHWRRSFRYKVTDSLLSQTGKEDERGNAPKYAAIHEFEQLDPATFTQTEEWNNAISTEWSQRIMSGLQVSELTFWKLYMDFPNTAHKTT
ncbi:hypothetical protein BT69DRAFT_1296861 [Atractiella rhizophila]|nr:hypothetical protein BT69DRAFT_1296861 [Atractiella rhizophila]